MVNAISTAVSGLFAQSKKLSVAASNIANASTVGRLDGLEPGKPYLAMSAYTDSAPGGGVKVAIAVRTVPTVPMYSPDSPYADAEGFVAAPNVNLDEELVSAKMAEQAYAANAKVIGTVNRMHDALMDAVDEKA